MAELEQPLLPSKRVYPGCPGCKIALLTVNGGPPPYKQLLFVAVIVFCNAMPICSLFPYVYIMVKDFNIAKRDQDVGFYAGLLGSVFLLGRFLTSMQWGMLADKYGRKPVIVVGLISLVIFNTLFGLSTNFWIAVLCRLLLGSLNGSFAPAKAFSSEVCSDDHQALSVSVVGTTWGLGLIFGPAIGGFFVQPALKRPDLFPVGSLFERFPYLLPSLLTSAIACVGLVITTQLPETLHIHRDEVIAVGEGTIEGGGTKVLPSQNGNSEKKVPRKSLMRNRPLLFSIFLFSIWAFYDIAFTEIFSFWSLSSRESGGLGFTTVDVGIVLALSGFGMLLCQLLVFPPVVRRLGPTTVVRFAVLITLPLLASYPLIAKLEGVALWASVLFLAFARSSFSATTWDGSFLLVSNSVKPSQRGAANGLATSLMALTSAMAPEAGGAIFAWSQRRHSSFLPSSQFIFFILALPASAAAMWVWQPRWPRTLDITKHEDDEEAEGALY